MFFCVVGDEALAASLKDDDHLVCSATAAKPDAFVMAAIIETSATNVKDVRIVLVGDGKVFEDRASQMKRAYLVHPIIRVTKDSVPATASVILCSPGMAAEETKMNLYVLVGLAEVVAAPLLRAVGDGLTDGDTNVILMRPTVDSQPPVAPPLRPPAFPTPSSSAMPTDVSTQPATKPTSHIEAPRVTEPQVDGHTIQDIEPVAPSAATPHYYEPSPGSVPPATVATPPQDSEPEPGYPSYPQDSYSVPAPPVPQQELQPQQPHPSSEPPQSSEIYPPKEPVAPVSYPQEPVAPVSYPQEPAYPQEPVAPVSYPQEPVAPVSYPQEPTYQPPAPQQPAPQQPVSPQRQPQPVEQQPTPPVTNFDPRPVFDAYSDHPQQHPRDDFPRHHQEPAPHHETPEIDPADNTTFGATPWAARDTPGRAKRGQVISVCAAKGGVGKSTTTLWLAEMIRAYGMSVCVVDGNVAQPDLLMTVGMWNQNIPGLAGLVKPMGQRYEPQELDQAMVEVPHLGDLLPGPPRAIKTEQEPALYALKQAIEDLRIKYDWVVVDTPVATVWEPAMLNVMKPTSDFVLVVVTPHIPTANDTRKWLRAAIAPMEQRGLEMPLDKFVGLVNKSNDKSNVTVKDLAEWLPSLNFAAYIPEVVSVTSAQNEKEWRCPQSARAGMMQLVQTLCGGEIKPPAGGSAVKQGSRFSKLLGRKRSR